MSKEDADDVIEWTLVVIMVEPRQRQERAVEILEAQGERKKNLILVTGGSCRCYLVSAWPACVVEYTVIAVKNTRVVQSSSQQWWVRHGCYLLFLAG